MFGGRLMGEIVQWRGEIVRVQPGRSRDTLLADRKRVEKALLGRRGIRPRERVDVLAVLLIEHAAEQDRDAAVPIGTSLRLTAETLHRLATGDRKVWTTNPNAEVVELPHTA